MAFNRPTVEPESQNDTARKLSLKGYSSINLIHGLSHSETVLDSLLIDQVSRPLIYGVSSTSETTARQQYTAVNG